MTDMAQIAARTRVALIEAEVARLAAENVRMRAALLEAEVARLTAENARMREVLATRASALGIPENLVGPSIDSIVRGNTPPR